MAIYVGGINHLFGYFLHQHEPCGHVQAVDERMEVQAEIIDKGLLEKHGV